MLRYTSDGMCASPKAAADLINALRSNTATDAFVFCHGWNNDWPAALARYTSFIDGFAALSRVARPLRRRFAPLLIGLAWPSTAMVFGSERGPRIASGTVEITEALRDLPVRLQIALGASFEAGEGGSSTLAKSAAEAIAAEFQAADEPPEERSPATHEEVLNAWRRDVAADGEAGAMTSSVTSFGVATGATGRVQAAGVTTYLDPRHLLRLVTLWRMKDRAGVIGRSGVAELIREVLDASSAHVHLAGHSFGAKLLLSALVAGQQPSRKISSLLLLQAAVSRYCFAEDVPGIGAPGGYRAVLDRVHAPITTTYSAHDFPLGRVYPAALRRGRDAGEIQLAGPGSPYEALGARGPAGCSFVSIQMPLPPDRYPKRRAKVPVLAVDGQNAIHGHGDVSNEACWWAMLNLVRTVATRVS
jgi:hypothetical protein